jgi:hypothetical protein
MPSPELREGPAGALLEAVDTAFATGSPEQQREALVKALACAFQLIETLEARLAEVEAHQRYGGKPTPHLDEEGEEA